MKYYLLILLLSLSFVQANSQVLKSGDIRVRDPYIYADQATSTYFLYAQAANRKGSAFTGVEVYKSKDLVNWQEPKPVLVLPDSMNIAAVWAPEMHEYNGAYYLFVTLTLNEKLNEKKPVARSWPEMNVRGTYIFRADSPEGPFRLIKDNSFTPENWMALDGTFYVEGGVPYMVFCHEWVQIIDGTVNSIQLKSDLSDTEGEPVVLFRASDAPGAITDAKKGKVTDGCFLFKSQDSGNLYMIWSTFISGNGYCVLETISESGKIAGPWKNQKVIYKKNGGHGMLFRSFGGDLLMSLHQPNSSGKERLHLFPVKEGDNGLIVEKEIKLK